MSHRKGRLAWIRPALWVDGVSLAGVVAPASASAAPATPVSSTLCGGSLVKDPSPTIDDPNLIDYKIHCSEDITAYTVIINRRLWDFDTPHRARSI